MRILHVTFGLPPYANGGLPLYVSGLVEYQKKMGHNPIVLEPGSIISLRKNIYKSGFHKKVPVYRIPNALPVAYNFGVSDPRRYIIPPKNPEIYKVFLKKIQPEVIHVHSMMGIHKEFFEIAKKLGIRIVMTTHDYYGLDLRAIFVDSNGSIYNDRDPKKTAERNYKNGISFKKQLVIQTSFYKRLKNLKIVGLIRKNERSKLNKVQDQGIITEEIINSYKNLLDYYDTILHSIDYYLFNSTTAEHIYKNFIPEISGKIIPLSLPGLDLGKKPYQNNMIKTIAYIGRKEKYKGIDLIKEAAKNNRKIIFNLYGDNFEEYASANINNCGFFKRNEIKDILQKSDLLIMPSIYFETFAFPVLEAIAMDTPVIVSSHVGAKDLLKNAPVKVIFEPESNDLQKCLDGLNEKNYGKYCEWLDSQHIYKSMEKHCEEIVNAY